MKIPFQLAPEHVQLSKGTRVVLKQHVSSDSGFLCKPGTMAIVTEARHPRYAVRTPGGVSLNCTREQLVTQRAKAFSTAARSTWNWRQLQPRIVLSVIVGSKAWNLDDEHSDTDIKGAFLLPFDAASGLWESPDEIKHPTSDAQYWEVEKFIRQAFRADANTLETLWAPTVVQQTEIGALLRERRDLFTSRLIYRAFGRYAISQFKKIRKKLKQTKLELTTLEVLHENPDMTEEALFQRLIGISSLECHNVNIAKQALDQLCDSLFDRGMTDERGFESFKDWIQTQNQDDLLLKTAYRPKNAYNLLRLLHSGIQWLRDGSPLIMIAPNRPDGLRERLMAVKQSSVPIEEVIAEAHQLAADFEQAWSVSELPDEPDMHKVDALLRECRESAACEKMNLSWSPAHLTSSLPVTLREPRLKIPEGSLLKSLNRYAHLDIVVCSVVGAHNFGFPSPDSDFDLKGMHIAPAREFLSLETPQETFNAMTLEEGLEVDFTSHEIAKALKLLLGGNGNMLERFLSPYQILPVPGRHPLADQRLDELRGLVVDAISVSFGRHYEGFFKGMLRDYHRDRSIKSLLYLFRIGMTGVHLMRTGQVTPDLELLLEQNPNPRVRELIAMKMAGNEMMLANLCPSLEAEILQDLRLLEASLALSVDESSLPPTPPNKEAFSRWLARWRCRAILPI